MSHKMEQLADELPVACNLSESEQIKQRQGAVREVFDGYQQAQELADGYAFEFPGDEDWAARLTEFVLSERKCCPFFIFELVFEPNLSSIWLRLRGAEGVKEFIRDGLHALDLKNAR